jgi:hypothetical protein
MIYGNRQIGSPVDRSSGPRHLQLRCLGSVTTPL